MRVLPVLVGVLILLMFPSPVWGDEVSSIAFEPGNFEGLSDEDRNRAMAMDIFFRRNPDASYQDFVALLELWDRESNWRTSAANPYSSARGIPQAMTSLYPETQSKEWQADPEAQIRWGLDYIDKRYGSATKALEHHDLKGWY